MKQFFTLILSMLSCLVYSQSLFEIKFNSADSESSYTCFLVYYNEENAYMRIKYYNRDQEFRVVNVTYKGTVGTYENGTSFFSLTGSGITYITDKNERESYRPDYFVWIGRQGLPYTTDQEPDENGRRNLRQVSSYREVQPSELTTAYLNTFFGRNEEEYLALAQMNSDVQDTPEYSSSDAKLHLIVLANTRIYDIGSGCMVDLRHLEDEFEGISTTLGISYERHLLYDLNFSKSALLDKLENLRVGTNDIVVFVYRGHGFRWSNQSSRFPSFALTRSQSIQLNNDNTIQAQTVFSQIVQKGARLNILLTDCCNSSINVPQATSSNFLFLQSNATSDPAKLKKLFMKRRGELFFNASDINEVSWTNAEYGGFFTTSFLQALAEESSYMKETEVSWRNVINNTTRYARHKSLNCPSGGCSPQNAIFQYNISNIQ
jgi:hypothetical protein